MFASEEEAMEAARAMHDVFASMLNAEPFVPFRFSLTSRSTHEIQKPEHVRLREFVAELGYPDPSAKDGFHRQSIIALEHVVSVEPMIPDEPITVASATK